MKLKSLSLSMILSGSLALLSAFSSPALAAPGDFDGDGTSDLSVALVERNISRTTWLARLTSGQPSLVYTFGLPGDALVSGKFFGDGKTYPGIVYVRSASLPLEWYVRNPLGLDNAFAFGIPGDAIPNQGDLDCDGVSDPVVVREGTGATAGFKIWFAAMSSAGGQIFSRLFGTSADKVYVSDVDGDGCSELVALRSGYNWFYGKFFSPLIATTQWGLNGDIPLLPQDLNSDGRPDFVISRRTGGVQVAYINYGNGVWETKMLGLSNSIPMLGKFTGASATFAWAQRDAGLTGVLQDSGEVAIFSHGIPTNAIIRPDGTVIQPTEDGVFPVGGSGGGTTPPTPGAGIGSVCSSTLGSGFLWKPASQDSGGTREGKPMIYITRNFPAGKGCLKVYAADGTRISELGKFNSERYYEGYGCGNGTSASGLATQARNAAGATTIYVEAAGGACYGPIPNPASRHDKR